MIHRVIVTCGPSYEPIDAVRRITNFSTGELGIKLAGALTTAGAEVLCFRGILATFPEPVRAHVITAFSTNDDLLAKLEAVADPEKITAVFHVAALADFRVVAPTGEKKIASASAELTLRLVPATKLIGRLPGMFPAARIVGWKYELDGTPADAVEKGRAQMKRCGTAGCVVNGAAYGSGFGFITPDGGHEMLDGKAGLCRFLVGWLGLPGAEIAFDRG